ncbi:MAG: MXAN_5187 C-terminal domain-containing protein [Polyangiaceae bacterium]
MEQIQIEELVAELETRVDRLRSLYEQYFMGIEKMEPHVPRKDVERRFQTMRREQIRNTALRFRFQMVLQKYNTYQSYWMRIMRQIEDGTYKRDVLRAKANLADRRSTRPPAPKEKEEAPRVMSPSMVDDFIFDTGLEEGPTRKVDVPTARAQTKSNADLMLEFSPFDETTTKRRAPSQLSLDEDPTGILPLIGNAAGNTGPNAPKARPAADPEKMRALAARIKAGNAAAKPPMLPGAIKPLGAPIGTPIGTSPIKPPAAPAMKPPPAPAMKPPTAPAMKPPTAPAMKPVAAPPPMKPPTPPVAMKPAMAPATMKALAPPMNAAPPPAAAPAPAPKAVNSGDLPDARVRQIYSQYVDTKRKQNESTTAITYEGVAKSLRESTARLKEKHGGNSVDFEVTVKEGKTILRPVLKKDAAKKDEK